MFEDISDFAKEIYNNFPITTVIVLVILIYTLWRVSGGVERGEIRHARGGGSLFLELEGVPGPEGKKTFFNLIPVSERED